MKIGIPRALLYYWYGHLWENFWQECGVEVITSSATDHQVIRWGTEHALDEICLPVKIFIGHVRRLLPNVDWVMIPHIIKVEPDAYICPKFMGLPDIVAHTLPNVREKMLVVKIDVKQAEMVKSLQHAALQLGIPKTITERAAIAGTGWQPGYPALQSIMVNSKVKSNEPGFSVGVLGHPYCIYDSFFNLDLLQRLNEYGVRYITAEMMPEENIGVGSGKLPKKLFWTVGKNQVDGLEWMLNQHPAVEGFIQITPFACGTEAIVGDLLERRIKQAGKPLLKLNIEEHSGEAGLITRLEAFVDLIRYRRSAC